MLIEIGIGDAFGAPFEWAPPEFVKNNFYLKYHTANGVGVYTDDTQMSLAIAEHMMASSYIYPFSGWKSEDLFQIMRQFMTHNKYAQFFSQCYNRDVRGGYSKRTKNLVKLKISKNVVINAAKLEPRNTNGSVMRAVPLGLYPNVALVRQAVIANTTLTHATVDCINATMFIALISHYYYHDYIKKNHDSLYSFLRSELGEDLFTKIYIASLKGGPVLCDAILTASFCYNIMENSDIDNMSDMLLKCIEPTGDVDSVAAICMGLASLKGVTNNLPMYMYDQLENGKYGKDYLIEKDKELLERYPKQ